MITIIEYVDGHIEKYEDKAPTITIEGSIHERTFSVMDENCVTGDEIPLHFVKRIIFEPQTPEDDPVLGGSGG